MAAGPPGRAPLRAASWWYVGQIGVGWAGRVGEVVADGAPGVPAVRDGDPPRETDGDPPAVPVAEGLPTDAPPVAAGEAAADELPAVGVVGEWPPVQAAIRARAVANPAAAPA
ncbi:MAG: hypothetical protein K6T28_07730 [Acidothermus sp.]|nr:hypothetical protein [Acidothermus sp.]